MSKLPSKSEILQWIADNPTQTSKRDIARAFGIKGAVRIDLKAMLKELEAEGRLAKRRSSYRDPDALPPVAVLVVGEADRDGDLFARPVEWSGQGAEPRVLLNLRRADPALTAGDRILARLTEVTEEGYSHTGRLIRRIGAQPGKIVGIFRAGAEGGRILPIDKGANTEWIVPAGATGGARDGELIEAEQDRKSVV